MAAHYIRFAVPTWIHRESQAPIGVIGAAYELLDGDKIDQALRYRLEQAIQWFEAHLAAPDRFNRTKSKGWYRRETRGIAWLRSTAVKHVAAMAELAACVTECGHPTVEIRSERVGYVVYEDDVQVVAEPFRDTPTK